MTHIYRASGVDALTEACIQTVLDPAIALGVVSADVPPDALPHEISEELKLDEVTPALNAAWQEAGYTGTISNFAYVEAKSQNTSPHIDQKKGPGHYAPSRFVVLSAARIGSARVRARIYPSVLGAGDTGFYGAELAEMRIDARNLEPDEMPIVMDHLAGEVLIIPTIPRPVAHTVRITSDRRISEVWDSVHHPEM